MLIWLVAVPAFVAGSLVTAIALRRGARSTVRVLRVVNGMLLVGGLALLFVALTGTAGSAASNTTSSGSTAERLGVDRRCDRGRGLVIRRRDRRRVHGLGRARSDQRATRDVRTGDGHRRSRGGHRDLRPDHRDHPHRQGMSRIAVLGERHRVEGFALAGAAVFVGDECGFDQGGVGAPARRCRCGRADAGCSERTRRCRPVAATAGGAAGVNLDAVRAALIADARADAASLLAAADQDAHDHMARSHEEAAALVDAARSEGAARGRRAARPPARCDSPGGARDRARRAAPGARRAA